MRRGENIQMTKSNAAAGYFRSGLPYNRMGSGPRTLILFQGLLFENKPLSKRMAAIFNGCQFLGGDYTVYIVTRKPGLPDGYSMTDISNDYAAMIREEFGGPVDVIGISTGGSLVQHFAADHPDLVRRLVIHSAAYTLGEAGKTVQLRLGELARQRRWRAVYSTMFTFMFPGTGIKGYASKLAFGTLAFILTRIPSMVPKDPSDMVITIEAEDRHNFKNRLSEITAPTLVIAGDNDPFYSETLFRETAEGIPNARLILYRGMGHPAGGKQFRQDVLAFLREGSNSP
jgi:pimeloyl-ACP methyl ester carboxylesterase